VYNVARSATKGSAAGPDGFLPDCLHTILKAPLESEDDEVAFPHKFKHAWAFRDAWVVLCEKALQNRLPLSVSTSIQRSWAIALGQPKPDGSTKVRPIAIGTATRRFLGRLAIRITRFELETAFGTEQFAALKPGGGESILHAVDLALNHNKHWGLLAIDAKNAFNTINRHFIYKAILLFAPRLAPFFRSMYGSSGEVCFLSTDGYQTLKAETGVQQGDPLGPIYYCLAMLLVNHHIAVATGQAQDAFPIHTTGVSGTARVWEDVSLGLSEARLLEDSNKASQIVQSCSEETRAALREVSTLAYMDDDSRLGSPTALLAVFQIAEIFYRQAGQEIDPLKSSMLLPGSADLEGDDSILQSIRESFKGSLLIREGDDDEGWGLRLLGSPIGSASFKKKFLANALTSLTRDATKLSWLPHAQPKSLLLTQCFVHKVTHLLRTVSPSLTEEFASRVQKLLCSVAKSIMGPGPSFQTNVIDRMFSENLRKDFEDYLESRLVLPLREGGFGIPDFKVVRHTAFFGSFCAFATSAFCGPSPWFPFLTDVMSMSLSDLDNCALPQSLIDVGSIRGVFQALGLSELDFCLNWDMMEASMYGEFNVSDVAKLSYSQSKLTREVVSFKALNLLTEQATNFQNHKTLDDTAIPPELKENGLLEKWNWFSKRFRFRLFQSLAESRHPRAMKFLTLLPSEGLSSFSDDQFVPYLRMHFGMGPLNIYEDEECPSASCSHWGLAGLHLWSCSSSGKKLYNIAHNEMLHATRSAFNGSAARVSSIAKVNSFVFDDNLKTYVDGSNCSAAELSQLASQNNLPPEAIPNIGKDLRGDQSISFGGHRLIIDVSQRFSFGEKALSSIPVGQNRPALDPCSILDNKWCTPYILTADKELEKSRKYEDFAMMNGHRFCPAIMTTLGVTGCRFQEVADLLRLAAQNSSEYWGTPAQAVNRLWKLLQCHQIQAISQQIKVFSGLGLRRAVPFSAVIF
jgi:hypothetical protein